MLDATHDRTVLLVTHRPDLVPGSPRIVALDGGRLTEMARDSGLLRGGPG